MDLKFNQIVDRLRETGVTRKEARRQVHIVLDVITEALRSGKDVHVYGFGRLSVYRSKPKPGYDLTAKHRIIIPAKNRVLFTPSSHIRRYLADPVPRPED